MGKLDVHWAADSDQPTTCPSCGARTEFVDHTTWQKHTCLNEECDYQFVLEMEDDR